MSSDFPTFAEVGEENIRERYTCARDFKHFQRMMKFHPLDYHAYSPRADHD